VKSKKERILEAAQAILRIKDLVTKARILLPQQGLAMDWPITILRIRKRFSRLVEEALSSAPL
jgi:hypothetical protein